MGSPGAYPSPEDIRELRRGGKPLFGWPYFVVDEVDEGYMTPNDAESHGQTSAETRCIRAIVDRARMLGLDGLVARASFFKDEARATHFAWRKESGERCTGLPPASHQRARRVLLDSALLALCA